jgi:hypothetical protein
VFRDRELIRIFGKKKVKATGGLRKLYNGYLIICRPTVFKSRKVRWVEAFSTYGSDEKCIQNHDRKT